MQILALIIGILKILGIILLIILALILLIILSLLFSKIKIDLDAKFFEEIQLKLKASYLFGILKYSFNYEKNQMKLTIFGKNIFKKNKKQNIRKNKLKSSKINNENQFKEEFKEESGEEFENFEQEIFQDKEKEVSQNKKTFEEENPIFENKETNFENRENKKEDKIQEEDFGEEKSFFSKIKYLKEKIDKNIIKQTIILIKKLIKAINFKKIKINLDYGFEEPYTTGKVCAIISIILPMFSQKHIKYINLIPNFQEKELKGETEIKIRTNLFKLLLPILFFICDKNIRKIIFQKGE